MLVPRLMVPLLVSQVLMILGVVVGECCKLMSQLYLVIIVFVVICVVISVMISVMIVWVVEEVVQKSNLLCFLVRCQMV